MAANFTQTCVTCGTVTEIDGPWNVTVYMCDACAAEDGTESADAADGGRQSTDAASADVELFEAVLDAEDVVRSEKASMALGIDGETRARAEKNRVTAEAALFELIGRMTPAQRTAYGAYRAEVLRAAKARAEAR